MGLNQRANMNTALRIGTTLIAVVLAALIGVVGVVAFGSTAQAMPTITVDDTGDPLVNGQNLIEAVADATAQNPTAADPAEIVLSAGIFDLNLVTVPLTGNIVISGAGVGSTTICNCAAHQEASIGSLTGTWFESAGNNSVDNVTFREGRSVLFDQSGGTLVLNEVQVQYTNNPDSGSFSPNQIVAVADGEFEFRNSTLAGEYCCDTARGINATGSSSILIAGSTMELEGFGTPFVRMEAGTLDLVGSTLAGFGYDSSSPIWATGAVDMTVTDSTIDALSGDFSSRAIGLFGGGSLDVVNSTLGTASASFPVTTNKAVEAVDAIVTVASSQLTGEIKMTNGVVHVTESNFDLGPNQGTAAVVLDATSSGSMTGATITYGPYFEGDTAVVIQGEGNMVLDGVRMKNARVAAGTICIDTLGEDEPSPVEFLPDECEEGPAPQSGYPDGPHVVPGSIEAEDYDAATIANLSYADNDVENVGGAYRDDAVDIWPTFGEPGFTVGRTQGGEWLEYSIDATETDTYDLGVRLATGFADPGSLRISVDGTVVGTIDEVPVVGWWNWTTISAGSIDLVAGPHVIRLEVIGNGQINLDRLDLTVEDDAPICAGLSQQGEDGVISGAMEASATAVGSVPGTPPKYSGFDGVDYVEYCVNADSSGVYELDTVVLAPDSASDSFFIAVNDAAPVTWHIFPRSTTFDERTVRIGNDPVPFTLNAGENVLRVYHREARTELDSFTFRPVDAVCDGVARQAADGIASGGMIVTSELAASVPNLPSKYGGFDGFDYVEYCVTVPAAGDYSIDATVLAPDTTQNSFFVEAGGQTPPVTWHIPFTAGLQTTTVASPTVNPARFTLDAGENIVRFYHRENGTELRSFSVSPVS